MRNTLVVTSLSADGWERYGRRMVQTFEEFWPREVKLLVYADDPIDGVPKSDRIDVKTGRLPMSVSFAERWAHLPKARGELDTGYNYRFDAVKFCNKPFALLETVASREFGDILDNLIWMDADTITHQHVPLSVVQREMCPKDYAGVYLGRYYKYSECGFLYFNLRTEIALKCIMNWATMYHGDLFEGYPEWHDSYLFDVVRSQLEEADYKPSPIFKNLTGHLNRKNGAGHPFVNSFLGEYMDHLKGDIRKRTGKPRPGDLLQPNDAPYWRD